MQALYVDASLTLPASALSWTATRSQGPGGQNVNKVSTRVELRLQVALCEMLAPAVVARLERLAGKRWTGEGEVLIACQTTRSQEQNLAQACEKLVELLRRALTPPVPRKKTRPTKASGERRLAAKRQNAERKRDRGIAE